MDKKDEIMLVNQESLAEKIYIIRGQQVKNNIEKFDDDFRFQLTKEEWEILIAKSETGSEAGIYMRIMVLKGEVAVKQSKALL